jgi:HEAT repeat protein
MVLNEQWTKAREFFSELTMTYPESEFCDDALYWTGYSRSQNDELTEAIEAYNQLIDDFPSSQYYDDAIADMTEAQTRLQIEQLSHELEQHGALLEEDRVRMERDVERQLQRLTWSRNMFPGMGHAEADPETQLRVDALTALNPDANDMASFGTLKEIALDQGNPLVLREHAVHIISGADNELALPVFIALAKSDTNKSLCMLSLDYLAQTPGETSVDALIEVFQQVSPNNEELKAHVFYSIAAVGNDQAVDFLSSVAMGNTDMNLRREAVFYLGSIGSEKSRTALQTILRGK